MSIAVEKRGISAKCLQQSAKIFGNVHVIALNIVELALFAMAHTAKTRMCRSF